MINTLNIGKYVYNTLKNNADLVELLGGKKIYPLVADNNVKYPFIIYKRLNLTSNGCKDGIYEDNVIVEVNIVSDKYDKSIEIANKVRETLEVQNVVYEDMDINDTTINTATEDFVENAYVQSIQFNLKINN